MYAATFAGDLDSIRFLGEAPAGAFVQRTGLYEAEVQGPQAGGSMTAVDAVVAVPEPSGAALLGLAVFSLALVLLTQSENATRRALSS